MCYYLSSQLPHLFVAMAGSTNADVPHVGLTEKGLEMYKRIRHFFQFAQEHAYLCGGEVVYAVGIIEKLVRIEREEKEAWKRNQEKLAVLKESRQQQQQSSQSLNDISSHLNIQTPTSIISDASLGTLLLLSVMLANKWLRDVPVRNSWWAKTFGVSLVIVNQSELILMSKLHDSLWVEASPCFSSLFSFILGLKSAVGGFPTLNETNSYSNSSLNRRSVSDEHISKGVCSVNSSSSSNSLSSSSSSSSRELSKSQSNKNSLTSKTSEINSLDNEKDQYTLPKEYSSRKASNVECSSTNDLHTHLNNNSKERSDEFESSSEFENMESKNMNDKSKLNSSTNFHSSVTNSTNTLHSSVITANNNNSSSCASMKQPYTFESRTENIATSSTSIDVLVSCS